MTKKAVRAAKRKPSPRKKAISAGQARRVAARHVTAQIFDGVAVQDGAKVNWGIYNLRLKNAWLIFPKGEPDQALRLCSSRVIVVSKRTGRVLYDGLTIDEG